MKTIIAMAAFATTVIATTTASAQQNCAPRAAVIEQLAGKYGESRQAIGIASQGRVVEVFASEESGSWTITVTLPSGLTCLVSAGDAFELLTEDLQPAGIQS